EAIRDPNQTTKPAPEALTITPILSNNEENRHDQREKQAPIPIFELGLDVEPFLPNDLDSCQTLFHDLEQYDEDTIRPFTKEKLDKYEKISEPEASPGPRMQFFRKDNKSKNLINEEFSHLEEITDKQKRDLEFREQEELGTALKRRAIVVHCAKVFRSYPDNRKTYLRKNLISVGNSSLLYAY
ncbi:8508_t:CDS:2, partial [Racocetra fulgida]